MPSGAIRKPKPQGPKLSEHCLRRDLTAGARDRWPLALGAPAPASVHGVFFGGGGRGWDILTWGNLTATQAHGLVDTQTKRSTSQRLVGPVTNRLNQRRGTHN